MEADDIDLDTLGEVTVGDMTVEVIDSVADYAALMEACSTSPRSESGRRRLHHVVRRDERGDRPYATEILEKRLGFAPGTVKNGTPAPISAASPRPNLVHAKELYDRMMAADAPDFGAASDGDGDPQPDHRRGRFITPSDSLAMLAANAHLAPAYAGGLKGIARSMPTSAAADRVAEKAGHPGV